MTNSFSKFEGSKPATKGNQSNQDKTRSKKNLEPVFFPALASYYDLYYTANLANLEALSEVWIWDSANSRHIYYDCRFFNSLRLLHKEILLIKTLQGRM